MTKNPALKPLKKDLKIAKANYAAAVKRVDAEAARAAVEQIGFLRSRIAVAKAASADYTPEELARKASKARSKTRPESAMVYKAASTSPALVPVPADRGLEEIRYLKGLLGSREGDMRSGALQKLQSMLTADELSDVLTASGPEAIVRFDDGSDPRQEAEESHVARMLKMATDRSAPAGDRTAAADWLTRAATGDPRATDALARIVADGGVR